MNRFAVAGATLLLACGDPVQNARIDALGPETEGVARGPLHRAGQPCLACHDGRSGDVRELSVAGTVFTTPGSTEPLAGARVELRDSAGVTFETATNCAGNFFVEPAAYAPTYPLWVAVRAGDYRVEMDSPVRRDGSCASCHATDVSPTSTGAVYLYAEPSEVPADQAGCP